MSVCVMHACMHTEAGRLLHTSLLMRQSPTNGLYTVDQSQNERRLFDRETKEVSKQMHKLGGREFVDDVRNLTKNCPDELVVTIFELRQCCNQTRNVVPTQSVHRLR